MSAESRFTKPDPSAFRAELDAALEEVAGEAERSFDRATAEGEAAAAEAVAGVREEQRRIEEASALVERASVRAIEAMAIASERLAASVADHRAELPEWGESSRDPEAITALERGERAPGEEADGGER